MATAATAAPNATKKISAQPDTVVIEKCPKCMHRVEKYLVDTNCRFSMCENVDCTWPFDTEDMSQYIERDATVPSLKKRSKKRKGHKDGKSNKDSTINGNNNNNNKRRQTSASLASLSKAPKVSRSSGDMSVSSSTSNYSSKWMDSVLSQGKYHPDIKCETDDLRKVLASCTSAKEPKSSNTGLLNDPAFLDIFLSSTSPPFSSSIATSLPSPLSYESSPLTATATATATATTTTEAAESDSSAATVNYITAAQPVVSPIGQNLVHSNVADLFAAFNTVASTDDAVIPRASRQPSPTTTNNSESGVEDSHSILTPDEIASLIGGEKDIADILSSIPQPFKTNDTANSATDFEKFLPNTNSSATSIPAPATTIAGSGIPDLLDLLDATTPAQQPSSAVDHIPFDFSQIFGPIQPSKQAPVSTSVPLDTSFLDSLLGSTATTTPSQT